MSASPVDGTVMWLTWRQLFARRRLWIAVAFALAPALIALAFNMLADDTDAARVTFFTNLGREIVLGTLLPVAAMVFATTAFGGEIEDGTLVYLLVKPIARWRVALSKFVVTVLATFAVGVLAILLPWVILRGDDVPLRFALALVGGAGLATLAYCAIFLTIGLFTKRALVVALMYIILFESIASRSMAGTKSLSVREFAVAVAQKLSDGKLPTLPYFVPISTVVTMGAVMVVGALALGMWKLSRFEVAERL